MTELTEPVPCPVCQSADTHLFFERSNMPVHQHLVCATVAQAEGAARGDLAISACAECGFVFNQAFDESKLDYGAHYDNSQNFSSCFTDYTQSLVRHMVDERGVRDKSIVEVGCGKGYFLRALVEPSEFGNSGIGFDPTYIGDESALGGRLRFIKQFYSAQTAALAPNVEAVVCRHVIEHVPDVVSLLREIRRAIGDRLGTRLFFETPDVLWILRNQVIWDFFYEHCSYFSEGSIRTAFESAGFRVDSVERVFGEQYLWLEATAVSEPQVVSKHADGIVVQAQEFSLAERKLREQWKALVTAQSNHDKIAIWGAGAKGVTFANLIDPKRSLIDCIIDLNPNKQGGYLVGSGHPIASIETAWRGGVKTAILMNSNYASENESLLRASGTDIRLISTL